MQAYVTGFKAFLLGAAVVVGSTAGLSAAHAKTHATPARAASAHSMGAHAQAGRFAEARSSSRSAGGAHVRMAMDSKQGRIGGRGRKAIYRSAAPQLAVADVADVADDTGVVSFGRMSCVPFARLNSGIELAGNAWSWWNNADGVYQRGARPEVGSVLNFRANGHMHSGHVAVVTQVENARTVDIDHANWSGRGTISRNVRVVDVSPMNDWTAVRVALSRSGDFGSVYPTYGFIYDRPDAGTMVANNATAPMPMLANAAPRDLRPAADQLGMATGDEPVEVAEATPRASYRRAVRGHSTHELVRQVKATSSRSAKTMPHAGSGRKHTRG